jgi:hypothetical protein
VLPPFCIFLGHRRYLFKSRWCRLANSAAHKLGFDKDFRRAPLNTQKMRVRLQTCCD